MLARAFNQLRSPLFLNGYAMVFSSGITSLLGLVYWILAARLYPEDVVGVDSAILTAMFFLVNLSQFNLVHGLNRFVPSAGRATAKLVLTSYLTNIGTVVVASVVFLVGLEIWAPSLGILHSSPGLAAWFIFAAVSWCVFTLQDAVLVGLRQAKWVPLSTTTYALTKLGLIAFFVAVFPQNGIFMSWTMPVLLLIIPVNLLIFFRLIPAHVRNTPATQEVIRPGAIARFVAGDYFSSLIWMTTLNILPILVVEQVGAAPGAYFYLAWSIAYTLYLLSVNMGMSLVTEGVRDETKLNLYSYQMLQQTLRLVVPLITVIVIGAPYILRLYGSNYAEEGSTLLRLLCLSAIPYAFVSIRISMARVQRQIKKIFLIYTSLGVLVLALSYILLGVYGLNGVGLAWLLGQSAVMLVLLTTDLKKAWLPHVEVPSAVLTLYKTLRGAFWPLRQRLSVMHTRALVPALAQQLASSGEPGGAGWQICSQILTEGRTVKVMMLGAANEPATAIFKVAQNPDAGASLERQSQLLSELHAHPKLAEWRTLMPRVIASSRAPKAYVVEQRLPGVQAEQFLTEPAARQRAVACAVQAISEFHTLTGEVRVVDRALLEMWLGGPLSTVSRFLQPRARAHDVHELAQLLTTSLLGKSLPVSWLHGDYSPQNVLLREDGQAVSGIVDWEWATPHHLSVLDPLHFLVATHMFVERKELGGIVCDLLTRTASAELERVFTAISRAAPYGSDLDTTTLVLLLWLRHVGKGLPHENRAFTNALWTTRNIERVVACAVATARPAPQPLLTATPEDT